MTMAETAEDDALISVSGPENIQLSSHQEDDALISVSGPENIQLSSHQATTSLPPPVVDPGSSRPSRSHSSSRESRARSSRRGHGHRSRSSGSRHRHSSRRHSRHNCRMYFKHKERNFAAASCSMIAIVLMCTALVPDWIYLSGGGCRVRTGTIVKQLSTTQFFYNGHFYKNFQTGDGNTNNVVYKFGPAYGDIMINCVNYMTVLLFKTIIAFTVIAVVCSLLAFVLDLVGPDCNVLKLLRRNAIFNILTVVMCVAVDMFAYWITTDVEKLQMNTRIREGSKVEVTFDISFYLITAAGGMSVIATACNCLRRHSSYEIPESSRYQDHIYFDDVEALLPPSPTSDHSAHSNLPPPPAYTP